MVTVVDCPTCAAKVEWKESNRWRPFCSERCKKIDLGAWAAEEYRVPEASPSDDELDIPPDQR
mgnify:CR=1 FL=1